VRLDPGQLSPLRGRARPFLLVVALALGSLLSLGQASAVPASLAACSPLGKSTIVHGAPATIYCGPATATVRFGGKTARFRNGTCTWRSSSFRLRMGTIYLSRPSVPPRTGLSIYAAGVPTARALVEFTWAGRSYVGTTVHMTAKPDANRTGGTFRGRLGRSGSGPLATGTIRCS
jgi:hypothetical protein